MTRTKNQHEARESGLFLYPEVRLIASRMLDLIFPPRCQYCGRVDTPFCEVCTGDLNDIPVTLNERKVPALSGLVATGTHHGLLQAGVQALKYQGQQQLGDVFAKRLVTVIRQKEWIIDTIIPVPIHADRLQKRGYNQAKVISILLAGYLNVSHQDNALIRHTQKQSQVGLSADERLKNVKGDFTLQEPEHITGSTVLMVDDVRTTGATLIACASELLQHGATNVYGVTVTAAERST